MLTSNLQPGGSGAGASFWQATAEVPFVADALPGEIDTVVIGGGLLGGCTAYWLARNGVRVALIERNGPAAGASGRNGGFIGVGTAEDYPSAIKRIGHADARAIWELTIQSQVLLRQVLADEMLDCEYREPGHLNLALGEEQFEHHASVSAALHADGFTRELLDRQQTQALINTPLGPEITGALLNPVGGLLHSARLIQGLIGSARRHGALACIATVHRLTAHDGGVQVETSNGRIFAKSVVVAANAWTDEIVPALRGIITPVRGQVLSYASMDRVFTTGMGAAVTPTGEYWHQVPDGSIVLGGCRASAPGGEVGERTLELHQTVQTAIEGVFPQLFPQLSRLNVERRWAGLMAFTSDYLPVADVVPGIPGAWVVGGFCGHGMPFGMRLGQLLAQAASSGITPAELAPLRLNRPTLG